MKNIELAFKKYTNVEKIRKANFVNLSIKSNIEDVKKRDTTLNTIISLMAKGDMNCAGKPIAHKGADLFGQTGENAPQAEPNGNHVQSSTQTGENKGGNTAEPAVAHPLPNKEENTESEPPKASIWSKIGKKLKNFGGKIMEEE